MIKICKLNYDRKVRYLKDNDTEECRRLFEEVINHYGQFLEAPHGWDMDSIAEFEKVVRNCGLSVNEFQATTFTIKTKPKKKTTVKKPTVTKKKVPVKKPIVKKKPVVRKKPTTVTKKKVPVTKKTLPKKKSIKKVA